MDLLFRFAGKDDSKWDRLIVFAQGTPIHAEVRRDDGTCFSAEAPNGVRFLDSIDTSDSTVWSAIPLPWQENPVADVWANEIVGRPYDYIGAASSAMPQRLHLAGHYFCSDVCCGYLSRCGVLVPELLNPHDLYHWVCQALNLPRVTRMAPAVEASDETEAALDTIKRLGPIEANEFLSTFARS